MKGLLKNNFLGACASGRIFAVFMLLLGIFVSAVISQSLLIGYVMIGMVGFPICAIAVAKNEFTSKWGKYKLTLPVKRADIVKSLFLNQLIWLLIGTLFALAGTGLSWLLHGCPFDQPIDIVTMFALGLSISLLTGAAFFPMFYLGGAERSEVFLLIALLCAVTVDSVIISVLNDLLEPGTATILFGAGALAAGSLLAFGLSCPLSVKLFRRNEY